MPYIRSINRKNPVIHSSCFIAETANIIGDVQISENSSIWFNAVIRGDVNYIKIGSRCNVQDGAVIHGTYEYAGTTLKDDVSIGHNAIVHGAMVEEFALVGMGAIVMDKAVIGHHSIIAAGSVVKAGTRVEPYTLWAGTPAKLIKKIDDKEKYSHYFDTPSRYIQYSSWFLED